MATMKVKHTHVRFCADSPDTLTHLFWDCRSTQTFWNSVSQWMSENPDLTNITLFLQALCLGLIDNQCALIRSMEIEKQIAFDKSNLASFRKKWAYFTILQNNGRHVRFSTFFRRGFRTIWKLLEAMVSNLSLYELSVEERKNIPFWNEITSDYLKYTVMVSTLVLLLNSVIGLQFTDPFFNRM